MSPTLEAKKYKCERCGKAFTSPMRLGHHRAAQHAPRTSRDIPTTGDIRHRPQSNPKSSCGSRV